MPPVPPELALDTLELVAPPLPGEDVLAPSGTSSKTLMTEQLASSATIGTNDRNATAKAMIVMLSQRRAALATHRRNQQLRCATGR